MSKSPTETLLANTDIIGNIAKALKDTAKERVHSEPVDVVWDSQLQRLRIVYGSST
jgi:hypothetical protein